MSATLKAQVAKVGRVPLEAQAVGLSVELACKLLDGRDRQNDLAALLYLGSVEGGRRPSRVLPPEGVDSGQTVASGGRGHVHPSARLGE